MSVIVQCKCGARFRASDDKAGNALRCPKCKKRVLVPFPSVGESEEVPADNDVPADNTAPYVMTELTPPAPSVSNKLARHLKNSHSKLLALSPRFVSFVALAVAIGSLCWTVFYHPLGAGIDKYDFSTPKASLLSSLDMQNNQDIRAMIEVGFVKERNLVREKRKTIKVHKQAEYGPQKILFITYEKNGIKKYDTQGFEKNSDSGLWFASYVSTYGMKSYCQLLCSERFFKRRIPA